jgi:hypothetical protein
MSMHRRSAYVHLRRTRMDLRSTHMHQRPDTFEKALRQLPLAA